MSIQQIGLEVFSIITYLYYLLWKRWRLVSLSQIISRLSNVLVESTTIRSFEIVKHIVYQLVPSKKHIIKNVVKISLFFITKVF